MTDPERNRDEVGIQPEGWIIEPPFTDFLDRPDPLYLVDGRVVDGSGNPVPSFGDEDLEDPAA
jgi:hypothetical protein